MSEPVLKAIIQLLAMSASVDGVITDGERKVTFDFIDDHINKAESETFKSLFDEYTSVALTTELQTTNIAKKINAELDQKQKMVVLTHLFELISADGNVQQEESRFVHQLANQFNIAPEEYELIKSFVGNQFHPETSLHMMVISNHPIDGSGHHLYKSDFQSRIHILRIPSLEMYMLRYFEGGSSATLNNIVLKDKHIYTFSNGSAIRSEKIQPIYYSDVVSRFMEESENAKITFEAQHIYYTFSGGKVGLRDVNIAEESGKLIGLMGASGSGKSTLLNVLNSNLVPIGGKVLINGIDIHDPEEKEKIEGVIGYVPQDDLLIEELTVYQNLYYAAKLSFKDHTEKQIDELVLKTLSNLGLLETKDLRVGNALKKTISGGQRKRLNIGLELLREPGVLFLDEPTSGLSSNDSENILDLLKELSLKGKLIFVVIHQPSSDIFKMFDKLIILDVGGYQIYYGNPIEAVNYFRKQADLINSGRGICDTCGNVNPEQIFNIIETKLVDEYGQYTDTRKISPVQWRKLFEENIEIPEVETSQEKPTSSLFLPSKFRQFWLFSRRDLTAKFANSQYMWINLLEAPLLAFILSYIVRFYHIDQSVDDEGYIFGENMNIGAYIFMSIIVSLFIGLTVSAEEIIKDAKILKRESFLHLSRTSYLFSKIATLFSFSAIQMLTFVLIGNWILGIEAMSWRYWAVLFSTACFANMLGLNISATFNSVITIYILIPILLIPQLVLGGIVVKFDDINPHLASENKVPFISELMTARWSFEALAVTQFKDNLYERQFFDLDRQMAMAEYKKVYYIPKLETKVSFLANNLSKPDRNIQLAVTKDIDLLANELRNEQRSYPELSFAGLKNLKDRKIDAKLLQDLRQHLESLRTLYIQAFNQADKQKNRLIASQVRTPEQRDAYLKKMLHYHNRGLEDLVKNAGEENRIVEQNGKLIQKIYSIYLVKDNPEHFFDFRSHFFAPQKHFAGRYWDTFWFNIAAIWAMTLVLYAALYFKLFRVILNVFGFFFAKLRGKAQ